MIGKRPVRRWSTLNTYACLYLISVTQALKAASSAGRCLSYLGKGWLIAESALRRVGQGLLGAVYFVVQWDWSSPS